MVVSADKLKNRPIIGSNGFEIGEVVRVLLDSDDLKVVSIEARLRGDVADQLRVAHGLFRAGMLEIPVGYLRATADNIVLTVSLDELLRSLTETPPATSR